MDDKLLTEINHKLNIILIIMLKANNLTKKEIAKTLGIGDKSIDNILPYNKLTSKSEIKEGNE